MSQRVAVCLSSLVGNHSDFLSGMRRYRSRHQLDWQLDVVNLDSQQQQPGYDWHIVMHRNDLSAEAQAASQGICVVFGQDDHRACEINEQAFGLLACRHLQEQGYQHVAMLETGGRQSLQQRLTGFRLAHEELASEPLAVISGTDAEMLTAIGAMPRPLALFCASDGQASWLRSLVQGAGYQIPEDIAIIGCGDTARFVLAREPELSSVTYPWFAIGQTTARCLHQLMQGSLTDYDPPVIQPVRVVKRQSTRSVVVDDPMVLKAESWLRQHLAAARPLEEVSAALDTTPHTICRHFKSARGVSPKAVHQHFRLAKACDLLTDSDMSISSIATACGFTSSTAFGVAFKRQYGNTPGAYRSEAQAG